MVMIMVTVMVMMMVTVMVTVTVMVMEAGGGGGEMRPVCWRVSAEFTGGGAGVVQAGVRGGCRARAV